MIGIYKIQSIIKPERIYIGSSINITDRWINHLKELKGKRHRSIKLQNHYNKYGKNDLIFSIIIGCDVEDLIVTEQFFLDILNPWFNINKIAGCPPSRLGKHHKLSEDTKKKMRKPKSKEHIESMRNNKNAVGNNGGSVNKGRIPWNKGIKQKNYKLKVA